MSTGKKSAGIGCFSDKKTKEVIENENVNVSNLHDVLESFLL